MSDVVDSGVPQVPNTDGSAVSFLASVAFILHVPGDAAAGQVSQFAFPADLPAGLYAVLPLANLLPVADLQAPGGAAGSSASSQSLARLSPRRQEQLAGEPSPAAGTAREAARR